MIREILVPLDTSDLAELAIPHALAIAAAFEARIHLVSVLEQNDIGLVDSVEWRLRRDHHEYYLSQIASTARESGVAVTCETSAGPAAEQIVEMARVHAADLIVLTTHGCGGHSHFKLSGTASKVISNAGTSVLIVQPSDRELWVDNPRTGKERLAAPYGRILAPVDCSHRADWAVCLAAQVAEKHGGELLLVSVIESPEIFCSCPRSSEQNRLARRLGELNLKVAEEHLRMLERKLEGPGLRVSTRVVEHRDAASTLCRIAEEECSLVVLSAHGHSAMPGSSYGSVARHLLESCTKPVLVFQDNLQAYQSPTAQETTAQRHQVVT